jgi:hypothetical protein
MRLFTGYKTSAALMAATALLAPVQNASAECDRSGVIGFSLATIFPAGAVAGGIAIYVASATMDTSPPPYNPYSINLGTPETWRTVGYVAATVLTIGGLITGAVTISEAVRSARCSTARTSLEPLNLASFEEAPLLRLNRRSARELGIETERRDQVIADWSHDLPALREWIRNYRSEHTEEIAALRGQSPEQQREFGARLFRNFAELDAQLLPGAQEVLERIGRRLNERVISASAMAPAAPGLSFPIGDNASGTFMGNGVSVSF